MVYNTQKYKRVIAFPIQGQVWTHRGDLEYRYEVIVVGAFCVCRNKLKLINSTTYALVLVHTRFYASRLIYSIYYRYMVPIITVQCMEYEKKNWELFFVHVYVCVWARLFVIVLLCIYYGGAYILSMRTFSNGVLLKRSYWKSNKLWLYIGRIMRCDVFLPNLEYSAICEIKRLQASARDQGQNTYATQPTQQKIMYSSLFIGSQKYIGVL